MRVAKRRERARRVLGEGSPSGSWRSMRELVVSSCMLGGIRVASVPSLLRLCLCGGGGVSECVQTTVCSCTTNHSQHMKNTRSIHHKVCTPLHYTHTCCPCRSQQCLCPPMYTLQSTPTHAAMGGVCGCQTRAQTHQTVSSCHTPFPAHPTQTTPRDPVRP